MCAEKMQRILMAIMLTLTMVLFLMNMTNVAVILQVFIIIMLFVWAFTDFCPSLWFFNKIFGPCDWGKK